jgi:hypothetical protein
MKRSRLKRGGRSSREMRLHTSDSIVDAKFSNIIREMSDDKFWQWVSTWKDPADLIDQAEEWDTEIKRDELPKLRKLVK